MTRIIWYSLALLLAIALAIPATAARFDDRDALTDILTLDEQAPLADAEETLEGAEEDLADAEALLAAEEEAFTAAQEADAAAQEAVTGADTALGLAEGSLTQAEQDLQEGIDAMLPPEQIEVLEQAVTDATMAVTEAEGALDDAQETAATTSAAATEAEMDVAEAQDAATGAQTDVAEALAALQVILDEIEGTEELVAALGDKQAFALLRSLNNAVKTGLLPLDLDVELLQRIIDEGFGSREIQALTNGFEQEARFERLAARFETRADATGNDRFLQHAERARDRGASQKEKFLARLDEPGSDAPAVSDGGTGAGVSASEAARNAAGQAAREAALAQARGAAGEAASEAAQEQAREVAGETAREVAKSQVKAAAGEAAREAARENAQGRGRGRP